MAIKGLYTQFDEAKIPPELREAIEATIRMVRMLEKIEGKKFIKDERLFEDTLTIDFLALSQVGDGRLYLELPAAVRTDTLVCLASLVARSHVRQEVSYARHYWNYLGEETRNGMATTFSARMALPSQLPWHPLLHYTDTPVHDLMNGRRMALRVAAQFTAMRWINARPATHRDFLVWYIMDCIRSVPPTEMALADSTMWVPVTGLQTVRGSLAAGSCGVINGKAYLLGMPPLRRTIDVSGIGLSLGLA